MVLSFISSNGAGAWIDQGPMGLQISEREVENFAANKGW